MSFSMISKSAPELVAPSEPTPAGNLPLSFLDHKMKFLLGLVLVFDRGEQPAELIMAGLSKALVYYYPVAGRFAESDNNKGELQVACTGEGVWFTKASANCTLEDVKHLQPPLLIPQEELVPLPPSQVDARSITFMMQVTEFTCGGFVIGIKSSHAMLDGVGAVEFLKAVAELARSERPSTEPTWSREAFPVPAGHQDQGPPPPPPSSSLPPIMHHDQFEQSIIDVSLDTITRIKNQFTTEKGEPCSSFDVVAAAAWKCRTVAINLDPDAEVRLGFAASIRRLLQDVLPQDKVYYGNCVHPVGITSSSGKIISASIFEIITIIRDAKKNLPTEFAEWIAGDSKKDPYAVPMDYGTFFLTDWTRAGFFELDFGWGEPTYVSPVDEDGPVLIASCLILKPPSPKQGVRLMARCVTKDQAAPFRDELMKLALA